MSSQALDALYHTIYESVETGDLLKLAICLESLKEMGMDFKDMPRSPLQLQMRIAVSGTWNLELAKFLTRNGAQLTWEDDGSSLFISSNFLMLPGILDVIRIRLEKDVPKLKDEILRYIIKRRRVDILDLLKEFDVDLSGRDSDGRTLLMGACAIQNNYPIVSRLLEWGADVNATDSGGQSVALHSMQNKEYIETFRKWGLVLAPHSSMEHNTTLQAMLAEAISLNNKDFYMYLADLAHKEQPDLKIATFEEKTEPWKCEEANVVALMNGRFAIEYSALEERKALIRKTKEAVANFKAATTTDEKEKILIVIVAYLSNALLHLKTENSLYAGAAFILLYTTGGNQAKQIMSDDKSILEFVYKMADRTHAVVFEE